MVRVTEAEAKKRFGELLRDVAEGQETVLIEKDGEPQAIFISLNEYARLQGKVQQPEDWREHLDRVRERSLPPAEDVIRRMREERDEQILGSLR